MIKVLNSSSKGPYSLKLYRLSKKMTRLTSALYRTKTNRFSTNSLKCGPTSQPSIYKSWRTSLINNNILPILSKSEQTYRLRHRLKVRTNKINSLFRTRTNKALICFSSSWTETNQVLRCKTCSQWHNSSNSRSLEDYSNR